MLRNDRVTCTHVCPPLATSVLRRIAKEEIGKKIRASANGTVIYAQYDDTTGYERGVKIRHGDRYDSVRPSSIDQRERRAARYEGRADQVFGESGSGATSVHLHNGNDVKVVLNGRQLVYFDSTQQVTSHNC